MKSLFTAIACLSFFAMQAQTADDIIKKYSDNLGGLDAFTNVKTAKFSGNVNTQGMDLALTTQLVNGKAMRTDIEVMGSNVTNCYADGKGWKINPYQGAPDPTEVTGTELNDFKSQTMLSGSLMAYKALGDKAELQGEETVEGVKTFKIKVTSGTGGKTVNYYISTSDYSLIKTVTTREIQGQQIEIETYYSDLKETGGLKFYMSRTQKIGGEVAQTITFDKIELGVPVDEKIFAMPK